MLATLMHTFELGLTLSTNFNDNSKILNKLFQMVDRGSRNSTSCLCLLNLGPGFALFGLDF